MGRQPFEGGRAMNPIRIGAWAGWLSLIMIFGYHLTLALVAGTRVSGTVDRATIEAFYANDVVAILGVLGFLTIPPFALFVVGLYAALRRPDDGRPFVATAVILAVVELPLLVTQLALQAGLVAAVNAGEPVVGMFRAWDALYNSGTYVAEAGWVLLFGLAMRGSDVFPRWMTPLSLLTSALLAVNVSAIWVGIPDAATLPSAGLLGLWFAGASIGLGRAARSVPIGG